MGLATALLAGPLNGRIKFLHWGVIEISLANLVMIGIMIAIFVLALVIPFPHGSQASDPAPALTSEDDDDSH